MFYSFESIFVGIAYSPKHSQLVHFPFLQQLLAHDNQTIFHEILKIPVNHGDPRLHPDGVTAQFIHQTTNNDAWLLIDMNELLFGIFLCGGAQDVGFDGAIDYFIAGLEHWFPLLE